MKCCCSAAVNTPCSTRHFGLTGFDCRVIERWINNLFLEVCRWVFVCLRSLSIFRCCLASSRDTGFTRECLAPCAGWVDCVCLWHSLARSTDAWSILGVFFQETVPSPSVSYESLFSPFSTFPLTGSNHLPSVFVNNLGCVCARVRVAECWLVLREGGGGGAVCALREWGMHFPKRSRWVFVWLTLPGGICTAG